MQTNLLTTLSVQELKRAVAIRERLDGLENELDRITGSPAARAENGAARKKRRLSPAARARISAAMKARWAKFKPFRAAIAPVSARTQKPSQRGQLKHKIIQTLKSAGNSGVTVKDLAKKTGRSYGNISVWFHSTAKGVKEIKKVAPGRFAWAA